MATVTITIRDTEDGGITLHSELEGGGMHSRALRVAQKLLTPLPLEAAIEMRRTEGSTSKVGRCEWCGLVDHNLVGGECPACRAKTREGV